MGSEQVFLLDKQTNLEVHFHIRPEVAVKHAPALVAPVPVGDGVAAAQETPDVVVAPDVENKLFRSVIGPLFPQHPAVGLVDAVSSHSEVPDRFPQVAGQILLP